MDAAPSLVVRRKRERQSFDPAVLAGILADGCIAHVAVVREGFPVVLPFLYAVGDLGDGRGRELLLHGSTGGGLFLSADGDGVPVSVGITHLDGFVLARSSFDSSANYRSAMIHGRASAVPPELRADALWIITDHILPGRRSEIREMTQKEIAQTHVLRVPLDQVSVKVRFGGAGETPDDGEDHGVWAGVLPVALRAGEPLTSPLTEGDAAISRSALAISRELDARAQRARAALATTLTREPPHSAGPATAVPSAT